MRIALALVLVVGCQNDDGTRFPVNPGGTNTGTGDMNGGVDAAPLGDSNSNLISGSVCLLTDARQPNLCATTGAGGLTVTLDGNTATTAADGTFVIASPTSSNLLWRVSGTDMVTSLMSYSAVHRIPIMADLDYLDLANANSVVQQSTFGDVFIHVTHTGTSLASVAASTTPLAVYATLFDGTTPTTWSQVGTSAFGMVWVPGLAQGSVTATLTPQGGTAQVVTNIPIGDQTLTWVSLQVP